jgi:tetratricopeptide (TPR) repeat protein
VKKILYTIVILGGVGGFFLFSTPGLDTLKRLPDGHKEATWAPFMYYNIARLHASMGRQEKAAEIYEQMLDMYDTNPGRKSKATFVDNKVSRHYMPYALFRLAVCKEKMADTEYNLYTSNHGQGNEKDANENLALSLTHYDEAKRLYQEFVNNFNDNALYSDANRRLNELRVKTENGQ